MIRAKELIRGIEIIDCYGSCEISISGVSYDSRSVENGFCFIAIEGFNRNGNRFVIDAVNKGASMIISEKKPPEDLKQSIVWVVLKDIRKAYFQIVSNFYVDPLSGKYVIGVTGTNGKTTVVSILYKIFSNIFKVVKTGTLGMECNGVFCETKLTTPEAGDLFRFLSEDCNNDFDTVIMEVSSAGLTMNRVEGIKFSQAVFTNLSGDHLDFHGTMDEYFSSKLSLFRNLSSDSWAVVNIDDKKSEKIIKESNSKYITFGFSDEADVYPEKYKTDIDGISARIVSPKGILNIKSSLIGRVNLYNILAAVASSTVKNIPINIIERSIEDFKQVKGRLNFAYKGDFSVIVDYAHSDDALKNLLESIRELTEKKLILVFGAGGSRDISKRPRMGKVASEYADIVIITSDNPRKEEPMDIISQIISGFPKRFNGYVVESDRKKAIETGLSLAGKGDIVVIAGKGHEDYQIFKDRTIHFDDFEIIESLTGGSYAGV